MAPTKNAGMVENTLHGFPLRELIRSRAEQWTSEDLDYAYTKVEQLTNTQGHQAKVFQWLDEIKEERRVLAANEVEERRHKEQLRSNGEAIKISRVALWVSIFASVVAVLAWLLPRSPN